MPQDTTVTFYEDGQYVTLSGPVDSIESLRKQYEASKSQITYLNYSAPDKKNNDYSFIGPLLFIGSMAALIYLMNEKIGPWFQKHVASRFGTYYEDDGEDPAIETTAPAPSALVYDGSTLKFTDEELQKVLNKYFVFFPALDGNGQEKFLHRLKRFISEKIFVIHDESGFKEMPILISASAIQISFGLDKYLLPHFSHIHIFPEEFIGYHPTLRLLEGNVSGHSVNLSWKHFMNGYKFPANGQNVGLHEFAHAFYYQYFETGENVEHDFVSAFPQFNDCGSRAFEMEKQPGYDLYSDYALTNFQEFWAESIEIFFERPADMKRVYPDLYGAICEILNQDPLAANSGYA